MITEPFARDSADKNKAQDLVRIELLVPRYCVENPTTQRLRERRDHTEIELRVIGLLAHLAERFGYQYGPELLHPLLQSMDDDCEEFAVAMLEEELRDLRPIDVQPQIPNAA